MLSKLDGDLDVLQVFLWSLPARTINWLTNMWLPGQIFLVVVLVFAVTAAVVYQRERAK